MTEETVTRPTDEEVAEDGKRCGSQCLRCRAAEEEVAKVLDGAMALKILKKLQGLFWEIDDSGAWVGDWVYLDPEEIAFLRKLYGVVD